VSAVYLGIGSNLGDRASHIRTAVRDLEDNSIVEAHQVSSLYESEPVGWDDGPWYLNAVLSGSTRLEPQELLAALKDMEIQAGREAGERNAPRPLDLDILLYDGVRLEQSDLIIPHPRILERAFVLWPLAEVAPAVEVAPGVTALAAADLLKSHEAICRWTEKD